MTRDRGIGLSLNMLAGFTGGLTGAVISAHLLASGPLPVPAPPPERWAGTPALAALFEMDTLLLAQLATGEDPKAAVAVTWVVLNRSGCQVAPLRCRVPLLRTVTQRRAFGTVLRGRWVPSWGPDRPVAPLVLEQVRAVLLGAFPDPTKGATCFHRTGTWTPRWAPAVREWRIFGSHAFYRPRRAKR